MPKRTDIKKILVIGSGPIIIGQAAEFDYSGSQACLALREAGYEVILVNSNPATIMTDKEIADKVFIEPLTLAFVSKIIRKELPDAILPTLGGQTGLNMAKELADSGILTELKIELLGTKLNAIEEAEDREQFKQLMQRIDEPIPESMIATTLDEANQFVKQVGFPVVIRPAYTMGGTGGGFAHDQDEFKEIVLNGLELSPVSQILVERSIAGFKEIEFEVMRDAKDNALIVASMENVDPVGIHTGDSIVVSPTQTLSDRDYQMLRDAALKIIRALKIEGGCNVQMALDQYSDQYYIIEVNPRVSRSSALASKATGYPIAKTAAKIAVGLGLDEIKNPITGTTLAEFEPALDYIVTKIPRWPFDKFPDGDHNLGTQMKATGEVMAIGRNFEESLLKAVRSLEIGLDYVADDALTKIDTKVLLNDLVPAKDNRLFVICELLRRQISVNQIHSITQINEFFLYKLQHLIEIELELQQNQTDAILQVAKQNGFLDNTIGKLWHQSADEVKQIREEANITPVFKMVDTVAGEFTSQTPYYYSTYENDNESQVTSKPSILVIGSGPIRIGQGVEFDYATVHCVEAMKKAGYESIIMNSNPETVSTDFSISDKLYFEPLTLEDVLNIVELEKPEGVIVQFGGQTAINLAKPLAERGIKILGTTLEDINRSEDRKLFGEVIDKLNLPQPNGKTATTVDGAVQAANEVGYPILIRPSYVLGGRAMEIIVSDEELRDYMNRAVKVSNDHPVLIDSYLTGSEAEVDIIGDGKNVIIPGIIEHIERAGVHSGDSMGVYPPQNMLSNVKEQIVQDAVALGKELNVVGLMNVQFVIHDQKAYVIEVNPRASRTVPFLSKVTGISMAQLATEVILDKKLADLGYQDGLVPESNHVSVKAPVFSFSKLPGVANLLGPEMKSTGEVMGTDRTFTKALDKAFVASGIKIPKIGTIFLSLSNSDLKEGLDLAVRFRTLGFQISGDSSTARYLNDNNITTTSLTTEQVTMALKDQRLQIVMNTVNDDQRNSFKNNEMRFDAIENEVPLFTSLDTLAALLTVLESQAFEIQPL